MRTQSVRLGTSALFMVLTGCSTQGPERSCEEGSILVGDECFVACQTDEQCDPALVCLDRMCRPVPDGECAADADCPGPGTCETLEGCLRGVCTSTPCGEGYTCLDGACAPYPGSGESCVSDPDACQPGLKCQNGLCCAESAQRCCASSTDCPYGLDCDLASSACFTTCEPGDPSRCADPTTMRCVGNGCVAKLELGTSCAADVECMSGHCADAENGRVCCETACDGDCMLCSPEGRCDQMPEDDASCVVDCSLLDTECRKYADPTTNRCAALGVCRQASLEVCQAYTDLEPGTICRAADGACDRDDVCDGNASCVDEVRSLGEVCRPAADEPTCDLEEVCDGATKLCPDDRFKNEGIPCRPRNPSCPSDGECCDVPDACSGDSPVCPDAVLSAGTLCRPTAGECDLQEVCTGTDSLCPADAKRESTYACEDPSCFDSAYCDGRQNTCPAVPKPRGTSCGLCEQCDGAGYCSLMPDADAACPGNGSTCYPDTCTALGQCAAKLEVGTICGTDSWKGCNRYFQCATSTCAMTCDAAGNCRACAQPDDCVSSSQCQ